MPAEDFTCVYVIEASQPPVRRQAVLSHFIREETEAPTGNAAGPSPPGEEVLADPCFKASPDSGPPEQLRLQTPLLGAPGPAAPHPYTGRSSQFCQVTDLVGRLVRNSWAPG